MSSARRAQTASALAVGLLIFHIAYQTSAAAAHETDHLSDLASIDCTSVQSSPASSPVARVLCGGSDGASADWDLNSVLWAVAGTNNKHQQKLFDQEQDRWRDWLNKTCFPTGAKKRSDASSTLMTSRQRQCVIDAFHKRATFLRSGLVNDTLAESKWTPEQHADVQRLLKARGLLQAPANGEFDSDTRKAIKVFQAEIGLPQTGFFDRIQIRKLAEKQPTGSNASAVSNGNSLVDARTVQRGDGSPILAQLNYDGKSAATVTYQGVSVTVDSESASPEEGRLPVATLKYGDGKTLALKMTGKIGLEEPQAMVRILRLDLATSVPQIVLRIIGREHIAARLLRLQLLIRQVPTGKSMVRCLTETVMNLKI